MPEKIMLVDGNSIINRAFYAIPLLTSKTGAYTNGVYGFLNILFKFLKEEKPEHLAVAFDLPAPTFRHTQFEGYKGTRKTMPDELRPQLPLLKSILQHMNIPIYEMEGYEADDVLGTMANKAANAGLSAVIVSGDRDMLQLCADNIKVRIPKTKAGKTEVEDYDSATVFEKLGVTPTQFIDVKALMGDTSDNIPGVPGIGEKTALKIITQYGSLAEAIAHVQEIKPQKASDNLAAFTEQALLSQALATIFLEVPLELNLAETTVGNIFNEEALKDMQELGFKSLIPYFAPTPMTTPVAASHATHQHKVLANAEDATAWLDALSAQEIIPVAFMFTVIHGQWLGLGLASNPDEAVFIPVNANTNPETLITLVAPFLASNTPKVTHDMKAAARLSFGYGHTISNVVFDTMLAAYLLDASKGAYPIEDVAQTYLNENCPTPESLLGSGKGKNKAGLGQLDPDAVAQLACGQVLAVLKSQAVMAPRLEENQQTELYAKIEHPVAQVLGHMETAGITVDKATLTLYGQNLDSRLLELTSNIYDLAGEAFNINSPAQLGVILFEKLGLKSGKKTKTGYSTAAEVLEKLAPYHPIVPLVLEYRNLSKLKSTYVEGLLAQINPNTGKIHTTFNQTIASTGRLSSVEPNLQNIPIRLPLGRQLRRVFVPSKPGYVFLDADYNQIELRVLAHMAGDERLIDAFVSGVDIHRLTASQVFNTPLELVTDKQRSAAKAVNFGIVYGIGAFSLSEDLQITRKEAQQYIDRYFETYPKVKAYLDKTIEQAKIDGYASTIYNRHRAIPELASSNFNLRAFGERVAMNMPVQGSAADIIKLAMIHVHSRLQKEKLDAWMVLQVHDELLLEVRAEQLSAATAILKEEMENCVQLNVPLQVDCHSGENWFDAK